MKERSQETGWEELEQDIADFFAHSHGLRAVDIRTLFILNKDFEKVKLYFDLLSVVARLRPENVEVFLRHDSNQNGKFLLFGSSSENVNLSEARDNIISDTNEILAKYNLSPVDNLSSF